jgi:hypothetical protein
MPFSIRVPSLITPVHCITQTEEPGFFMVGILDSEVVKSCGTFEQLLEMFGR